MTLTQADLDLKFTERAKQGERSKETELLGKLGVTTVEEAEALIKKQRAAEDANKTEVERLQTQVTGLTTERDQAKAKAQEDTQKAHDALRKAEIKSQATALNFLPDALEDVWTLVSTGELKDSAKVDETTLAVTGAEAAVKKVAELRPHWLNTQKPRQPSAPRGKQPVDKGKQEGEPARQGKKKLRL